MYCRNCGSLLNDKAEICVSCGCRPLNGNEYCQECGTRTTQKQEMCIRCGCRLKVYTGNYKGFWDNINTAINGDYENMNINSNFLCLPPYYQKEFQKIYDSGETYKGKFNIWAFLFGAIWALTKGCWLSGIACIIASLLTEGVGGVIYWFIFGFRGTYIYYCAYVKNKQYIV